MEEIKGPKWPIWVCAGVDFLQKTQKRPFSVFFDRVLRRFFTKNAPKCPMEELSPSTVRRCPGGPYPTPPPPRPKCPRWHLAPYPPPGCPAAWAHCICLAPISWAVRAQISPAAASNLAGRLHGPGGASRRSWAPICCGAPAMHDLSYKAGYFGAQHARFVLFGGVKKCLYRAIRALFAIFRPFLVWL